MNYTFHKTGVQAEETRPVNIPTLLSTHSVGSIYLIADIIQCCEPTLASHMPKSITCMFMPHQPSLVSLLTTAIYNLQA